MWVMSEASRLLIDEMMERLGEKANLVTGDQKGETTFLPEPREVNLRIPHVVADPFLVGDRGVGNEVRSSAVLGVSD